jgi:hypothetical protein
MYIYIVYIYIVYMCIVYIYICHIVSRLVQPRRYKAAVPRDDASIQFTAASAAAGALKVTMAAPLSIAIQEVNPVA